MFVDQGLEIGCVFGKDHGSIQFLVSQRGGIVPGPSPLEAADGGVLKKELMQNLGPLKGVAPDYSSLGLFGGHPYLVSNWGAWSRSPIRSNLSRRT